MYYTKDTVVLSSDKQLCTACYIMLLHRTGIVYIYETQASTPVYNSFTSCRCIYGRQPVWAGSRKSKQNT